MPSEKEKVRKAKAESDVSDIALDRIFKEFKDSQSLWIPVDILYKEFKDDPKNTMRFKSLEKGIDVLEEKIQAVDVMKAKAESNVSDIDLDRIFKDSQSLWNPVDILYQEFKDDPKNTMRFKSLEKGIDLLEEKIKAIDRNAKKYLEKLKKDKKKGQDGPDEDRYFSNIMYKPTKRNLLLGPRHGIVFEIDGSSKVLRSLQSPPGHIQYLSNTFAYKNNLYLGSALTDMISAKPNTT